MTSLLTVDASKYVGHSFFASADALPKCGTWIAHGLWNSDIYAPYFLAFENWLLDMLMVLQPDVFGFESPVIVGRRDGRGSDENNIRRLIGIVSVAELVCARRNIPCYEVHNSTSKSFMGLSRGKDKDGMVVAITRLGYSVGDHNQADACAVGKVIYSMLGEEP